MPSGLDRFLDRALKIRPGEAGRVGLMALYSFFAIGALIVGRTARDALFLADLPQDHVKRDLAAMYIANAVTVALLSWGYSRVADRIRRDKLNALFALGWAAAMAAFFLLVTDRPRTFAPLLYVSVEGMGALVVIQFWTFAQDVFNAREAKRLFGIVGAGGQVANIVYGFLAGSIAKRVNPESLLFLVALNLVACAVLALAIGRRYPASTPSHPRPHPKPSKSGSKGQTVRGLASRHLVLLAALAVVTTLAVRLVDFQFKAAADVRFATAAGVDKHALGAFFGQFYGTVGVAALAIQMLVTGRMLERFGILASLLPLPIGLAGGTLLAAVWPGGWAMSLAKGSDSMFRYTLNDASTQLLYVPVPAHQRGRVKAIVDGLLKPLAGVLAGLLLIAIGHYEHLGPLFHHARGDLATTALIVLFVVGWIALLFPARRQYVRSLLDTLQRRRLDLQSTPIAVDQATQDALAKVLRGPDTLAILHALALLPEAGGRDFAPLVAELLDHPVSSVRAAATDHFAEVPDGRYADSIRARLRDRDPWCVASAIGALCALERESALAEVEPLLLDPRPGIRAAVVIGLFKHGGPQGARAANAALERQMNATSRAERELAASVLGELQALPLATETLPKFLDDPSPSVRRAALQSAARLKDPRLVPHLARLCGQSPTAREAANALVAFGPGIEDQLAATMADPSAELGVREAMALVLGRLGTGTAAERLQEALANGEPAMRAAAAGALARLARRHPEARGRPDLVNRAVVSELDLAEHLVDVHTALSLPQVERSAPLTAPRGQGARELLALALLEERERAIERAIVLLELLYPRAHLDVVADNLRADESARRANAVEVLDNTVHEELKKRLLPLLEGRLHRTPPPKRPPEQWLAGLLAGQNPWIAACAAQLAFERGLVESSQSLSDGVKSPVAFVREACANALARLNPAMAKPLLESLQTDDSPAVRRVAEGALVLTRLASA